MYTSLLERPPGRSRRVTRWVLMVTLGESVGFTVAAMVGVGVTSASWGRLGTFVAVVLAGSLEGALLGTAQADCLYRWAVLPTRRWWIIATSVGAAVAWSLGILPSTIGLHPTLRAVIMVGIGGLLLLTSLPLAQYFVLRDHVQRPLLWIPINLAAWLLGIIWTLLPSPFIDQSTATAVLIVIYGIAGICMAATVAIITGLGITRLLLPPIEVAHWAQPDQVRRVNGSVDAQVE
jgi:hypothetical protein